MRRKGINNTQDRSDDSTKWMVTFSDLIMLLLTFFVLLLTMSTLDQKSLREMISYLNDSLGLLEFSDMAEVKTLSDLIKKYNTSESKIVLNQKKLTSISNPVTNHGIGLDEKIKDLDKLIRVKEDERGLSLSFQENIFFKSGTTEIDEASYGILESIANAIANNSNDILIMGHTDDVPIKNEKYPSNWELSIDRGLAVLDFFLKKKNLDPGRFAVGGYGNSRPLNPDDNQDDGASNRRVEIIFRPIKES